MQHEGALEVGGLVRRWGETGNKEYRYMRREEGLTNAVLLCLGYWAIHSKERGEWGGERGREIKYLVGEA